jgi:hypothetical protein
MINFLNLNLRNNYYINIIYMPVLQPQQTGMIGSSVRDSAYQTMQNRNNLQAALPSGGANKRRSRKYGGQAVPGKVLVPQVPNSNLINDPAKGTDQGVLAQQKGMTGLTVNNDAQKAFDNKVALIPIPKGSTGGSRRTKRRGGFVWPCMSGGKTRKTKNSRKSKKSKKVRKTRRH